jgi:hypothetical protein
MPQLVVMAMLVDTGDTETGQQVLAPFRDSPPAERARSPELVASLAAEGGRDDEPVHHCEP